MTSHRLQGGEQHQPSAVVPGGLAGQGSAWGMAPLRAQELGVVPHPGRGNLGLGRSAVGPPRA